MARIRTIKPEFWDSPDTAKASLRARLFYIALWNWADDYGKGTASAKALIGFAFPNDDDITESDYPTLASELHSAWKVVFYEVAGRPYYLIPSFPKHQRTEKKAASRIPDPPEPPDDVSAGQSHIEEPTVESDGASDAIDGSSVAGTGEQGNRGTGELVLVAPVGAETKIPRTTGKGTRIPQPFVVDEAMKDWAVERNMHPTWVMKHTERFINYWSAKAGKDGVKTDWRATWKNWLLKEQDDGPAYSPPVDPATRTYAKDDVRGRFAK